MLNEQTRKTQDPYTPPASDAGSVGAPLNEGARDYGYHARSWLLPTVIGLLGLQSLVHGVNAIACIALGFRIGDQEALLSLSRFSVLFFPFVYYGGLIPFGVFLVDANKNARAFVAAAADKNEEPPQVWGDEPELWGDEPERLEQDEQDEQPKLARALSIWTFSPASMVWWHFVPFLNLVRPYQAVKAVWECSAPEHASRLALRSNVLSWWWAAWLGNLLASRVRGTKMFSSFEVHDLMLATCDIMSVVACVFALRMVRALSERQHRRAAELWI